MLEENMRKAKVSRSDILGKLREANITQLEQVKAIVMEPRGCFGFTSRRWPNTIDEVLMEDLR